MSRRTEDAYVVWARRFVLFHGKRHPAELGAPEVVAFLSHLAVSRGVGAVTQNQALAALLFLYRVVLGRDLGDLGDLVRAKVAGVAGRARARRGGARPRGARWLAPPGRGASTAA